MYIADVSGRVSIRDVGKLTLDCAHSWFELAVRHLYEIHE